MAGEDATSGEGRPVEKEEREGRRVEDRAGGVMAVAAQEGCQLFPCIDMNINN